LGATVDETSVFTACSEGHSEVLGLLLENGGNPDARALDVNDSGNLQETALYEAAGCEHENIVRILLDHGADTNALSPVIKRLDALELVPAFVTACIGGSVNIVGTLLPLTNNLDKYIAMSFSSAVTHNEPTVRLLCPHLKRIKSENNHLGIFLGIGLKFGLSTSAFVYILEYFEISVDTEVYDYEETWGRKHILNISIKRNRAELASSLPQKGVQLKPEYVGAEAAVHLAAKYDEIALLKQLKSRGVLMGAP
jgi:ankyrin repeat protein